mgnify:CR=1 FL=1
MRQVICIGIGLILIFVVMPYALFVAATFMIAMPAYHDVVTWIDYLRLSFFPALSHVSEPLYMLGRRT